MTEPKEVKLMELEQRLDTAESTSEVWKMDNNTKTNVEQSWKDDKCAFKCDILKYILVSIVAFTYLFYQLLDYNDESKNSITRSTIETVTEYRMPYFIFTPWGSVSNVEIENTIIYNKTGPHLIPVEYITKWDVIHVNITNASLSNLTYDSSSTSWQLLRGVGIDMNWLILIPPYNQLLAVDHVIQLNLTSYARCECHWWMDFCEEKALIQNNSFYMAQAFQIQQLEGSEYGIYWAADSVQYLSRHNFIDRFDATNMHYTSVATTLMTQLSLTQQINEWHDTEDIFYDTKITTSYIDAEFNLHQSGLDQYCWQYTNMMAFRINPTNTQTVIRISRLKSIADMLSATGGLFSPILTGCTVFFAFLLTSKIFGCARKHGWSDKEKLKTALYLQELGLLTDQQYQEALQYKRLNK